MVTLGGVIIFMGDTKLWWLFFFISAIQIHRLRTEEKLLSNEFGSEYEDYKKATWF